MTNKNLMPREVMIRLFINGSYFTRLLCTPVNLRELVTGWLYSQRIIDSLDDIHTLGASDSMTDVSVQISEKIGQKSDYDAIISSGCGRGEVNSQLYDDSISAVDSNLSVEIENLQRILSELFNSMKKTRQSSGMHGALMMECRSGSRSFFAYDIGRHNAVDKVIGSGLLQDVDFSNMVLAASGRISSDMVLKATQAGIPIMISPRSVTTMAADIAFQANIAIAGRMAKQDRVYAGNLGRIKGAVK